MSADNCRLLALVFCFLSVEADDELNSNDEEDKSESSFKRNI